MARQVRIEYAGAVYHVMCRGDHQEAIFRDDLDRDRFLETLGEVCGMTGWRIHAYVLMGNHYHLLLETPEPNLSVGMQWFQGTYTRRFNVRHKVFGHLFQGRYKALNVDESGDYFETVASYVHLNPARARLVGSKPGSLRKYRWSSFPLYLASPGKRPAWLETRRVFEEAGFARDDARSRRRFEAWMDARVVETAGGGDAEVEAAWRKVRRGWCLGGETFRERLVGLMAKDSKDRKGESVSGGAVRAHDEVAARKSLSGAMAALGIKRKDLEGMPKGAAEKQVLSWWMRSHCTVSREWIAQELHMGHPSRVTHAVKTVRDGKVRELVRLRRSLERL